MPGRARALDQGAVAAAAVASVTIDGSQESFCFLVHSAYRLGKAGAAQGRRRLGTVWKGMGADGSCSLAVRPLPDLAKILLLLITVISTVGRYSC